MRGKLGKTKEGVQAEQVTEERESVRIVSSWRKGRKGLCEFTFSDNHL